MRKFNDKTGQRFGLLTVMYRIPNKNGKMYYHCKCDCGNEVDVRSDSLTLDKPHRSCGCYQKNNHPATFIDETGKKYGKLTVLHQDVDKESTKTYWVCCCECGNLTSVRADGLRSGRIKTCGCCGTVKTENHTNIKKNEIGNKYGKLTVIDETGSNQNGKAKWLCECECGNFTIVTGNALRYGNVISCGCAKHEIGQYLAIDETGNKYGKLTVISRNLEHKTKAKIAFWNCKCECGNTVVVSGCHLRSGHTTSCGCIHSKGEEKISKHLSNLNVNFSGQYTFADLNSDSNTRFRFDFAILNENNKLLGLIEYDGEQHYIEISGGSWQELSYYKKNDAIKSNYCEEHNIPLLRIPYWEFDNIENIISDFIKTLNNNQ